MMSKGDEDPPPSSPPKKVNQVLQVLRRSTRKRTIPPSISSVFVTPPPSSKKSRKKTSALMSTIPAPTLVTLPSIVIRKLLLYLDVDTLESLSATCSFFDSFIASQFITSINFPFCSEFTAELATTRFVEKKPLLKLKCKKSRDLFSLFPSIDEFPRPMSFHKMIVDSFNNNQGDYMVHSQLSLLSLEKLREVDLVPESVWEEGGTSVISTRVMDAYCFFDCGLLKQISRMGSFSHVTRLNVIVDQNMYLTHFISEFPSLVELGLNIITSKHVYLNEYLRRLQSVVAASKAPVLKVTVMKEMKRQVCKVLTNKFVEKLVVTGPCTLGLVPVMENLKEIEINPESFPPTSCTYWRSKQDDRAQHRAGLCCVNIGTLYQTCPKVERFMGVEVGSIPQTLAFSKWNSKVKKKFHQDYLNQGGTKEFKAWAKARWYSKKPLVRPPPFWV